MYYTPWVPGIASKDSVRWGFLAALSSYRADVELHLLGRAYGPDRTGKRRLSTVDHIVDRPLLRPLPDPGNWLAIWDLLSHCRPARQLRAFQIDIGIVALAEILRLEDHNIGPEAGLLRWRAGGCSAWQLTYGQVTTQQSQPPWSRAADMLKSYGGWLPPMLHSLWLRSLTRLADRAATDGLRVDSLIRTARVDSGRGPTGGRSMPVGGALGWGIRARATVEDAGLCVHVERACLQQQLASPVPPVVALSVGLSDGETDCVRWSMVEDRALLSWPGWPGRPGELVLRAAVDDGGASA